MNTILLVGHGNLPVALKESVQMIMGPCEGIHTVSLSPDDGKEDLERKLSELDDDLLQDGRLTVLTDVIGGSPCTAALEKYAENAQVDVIAGMNLPMVLMAALEGKAGCEPSLLRLARLILLPLQKMRFPTILATRTRSWGFELMLVEFTVRLRRRGSPRQTRRASSSLMTRLWATRSRRWRCAWRAPSM